MTNRLAVDIGGTFVDAISFDRSSGAIEIEKTSTTPADPSEGVLTSIDGLELDPAAAEAFVHGTTLGLNAFLERDGATTGIITNERFRDIYEIGRTNLPPEAMYDLDYQKPEPLVPRRRRRGVTGRLDIEGAVRTPLDEADVEEAAADLVDGQGVESLAICLLHSYKNADHEQRVAELVRDQHPNVTVSVSSGITREYREYERTSTVVLDAYIKPIFEQYVDRLDSALEAVGFDGSFYITRSGGGTLSADRAKRSPVQTILSGPAGGIIGAGEIGRLTGREDLITVDIGGTSTDACVVEGGAPAVQYEAHLEHLPLMIPVYDIRTIGAGGGSIAWLDSGLLKVGPRSAGAEPGPICYGQGGDEPTVTDAALALGYLDPDAFLGGEMELDVSEAIEGLERAVAAPLDTSLVEAARGVFDVTIAKSVGAIQEITVERGLDPREFSMVAFGGAGPLLVPLFARELGVREVVVPRAPSVFSAWGMLMADVVYDFSEMNITVVDELNDETYQETFDHLEERAREALAVEGFDSEAIQVERSVEMRYFGQEHTVDTPADDVGNTTELSDRFEEIHRSRYGHTMDDPAEVVSFRMRGIRETGKPKLERLGRIETDPVPRTTREAYCFTQEGRVEFDVYDRDTLGAGQVVEGPAVIQEPTTTIVCHSGQFGELDRYGNVIIAEGADAA